jgi:membrane protease YdiL (CAAX protease family)
VKKALSRYAVTVGVLWLASLPAGWFYFASQDVPVYVALPFTIALMVEAALYILPGFEGVRCAVAHAGNPRALAAALAAGGVLPYLIYSAPTGVFAWSSLAALAALAAAVAFWYVALPRRAAVDVLFLVLMVVVSLSPVFKLAIPSLSPKAPGELLGRLMWIRLGIAAMLFLRGVEGVGFGFVPNRRDWKIGLAHWAAFLPIAFVLNLVLGFARPRPWPPADPWRTVLAAVAIFCGMLWVTALSEEFFFRGLLQQWLAAWTGSRNAALLAASAMFGAAHLWFPPGFPNWRFTILAAAAGLFYGRAFQTARTIRAAMVTHALVNLTWRLFFFH